MSEPLDELCPRCGAAREPEQEFCLECGLKLPPTKGRLAGARRTWVKRVGWYPGDWVWVSLLTLLVAIAGAATAIAVTASNSSAQGQVYVATHATVPVTEPTPVPTSTAPTTVNTATLPSAPEPGTTSPKPKPGASRNGRLSWPANENGWTIVLVSYPKVNGRPAALDTAKRAAKAGLNRVGVLDSSRYASLQPGYFVVFTGVYGSKTDADAAVATARQAGFGGAYSRQIAR